jgi:hypothetical protein
MMRSALYYYDMLPFVIEYADEMTVTAIELADKNDELRLDLAAQVEEKRRWQKRAFIAGGTALLFFMTSALMLIW